MLSDKLPFFVLFLRGDAEHCTDTRIKVDGTPQIAGLSDVPQPRKRGEAPVAVLQPRSSFFI